MAIKSWFPTLIYEAPLVRGGARALERELLVEAAKLRAVDGAGQRWSRQHYPDGYTSYGSLHHLHRLSSTFRALEKKLDRHVRAFARRLELDLDGRRLTMTDCWVNI